MFVIVIQKGVKLGGLGWCTSSLHDTLIMLRYSTGYRVCVQKATTLVSHRCYKVLYDCRQKRTLVLCEHKSFGTDPAPASQHLVSANRLYFIYQQSNEKISEGNQQWKPWIWFEKFCVLWKTSVFANLKFPFYSQTEKSLLVAQSRRYFLY